MVKTNISMYWEKVAANILKSELKRKGLSYSALNTRLKQLGIDESEMSTSRKIARGSFSFAYFLQCMRAIETKSIDLDF